MSLGWSLFYPSQPLANNHVVGHMSRGGGGGCTALYVIPRPVPHLEVEHADLLHLLEGRDDPLLVVQPLHTPLQPVQLLGLTLLGWEGQGRG